MKKDVREVIQGEEPHLNNLLTQSVSLIIL